MTGEPRMAKANWQCPSEWTEWSEWLAAGLHARNRWRLPVLLTGILFAVGRRTVTSWLRAVGVSDDFQDYYYFLAPLGRKAGSVATQLFLLALRTLPLPDRLLVVIDDSPTKRYGPKVEGADIHHNPTPGPADQKYLDGHIWVTLSLALRHPWWGALALPLRAMLYVRQKTIPTIPPKRGWRFQTKLELAAHLVEWIASLVKQAGKTLWVVVDGGYTKEPFLRPAIAAGATIIGRLRKDAALRDLPPPLRPGQRRGRGRPRTYGKNRISLAKRAAHKRGWQTIECTVYGKTTTKTTKTFLATYQPAGGVIRVVRRCPTINYRNEVLFSDGFRSSSRLGTDCVGCVAHRTPHRLPFGLSHTRAHPAMHELPDLVRSVSIQSDSRRSRAFPAVCLANCE